MPSPPCQLDEVERLGAPRICFKNCTCSMELHCLFHCPCGQCKAQQPCLCVACHAMRARAKRQRTIDNDISVCAAYPQKNKGNYTGMTRLEEWESDYLRPRLTSHSAKIHHRSPFDARTLWTQVSPKTSPTNQQMRSAISDLIQLREKVMAASRGGAEAETSKQPSVTETAVRSCLGPEFSDSSSSKQSSSHKQIEKKESVRVASLSVATIEDVSSATDVQEYNQPRLYHHGDGEGQQPRSHQRHLLTTETESDFIKRRGGVEGSSQSRSRAIGLSRRPPRSMHSRRDASQSEEESAPNISNLRDILNNYRSNLAAIRWKPSAGEWSTSSRSGRTEVGDVCPRTVIMYGRENMNRLETSPSAESQEPPSRLDFYRIPNIMRV